MCQIVFIYADIIVNSFTAITLLHNWEGIYLPLIFLLIKISIFVYVYLLDNI